MLGIQICLDDGLDYTQSTGSYLIMQFSAGSNLVLNMTESILDSDSDYCFVVAQSSSSCQNDITSNNQHSLCQV